VVIVLVPIAVLLTAYVAYAVSQQSHAWADAIVRGFTAWIVKIPLVGAAVERLIVSGATWISNKLGNFFLAKAERVINWIGGLGHYAWMVANATLDWPIELLTTVRWLLTKEIPHLIRGLPTAVTRLVHQAQAIIGGLERDFSRLYAHLPGQVRKLIAAGLLGLVGPFLLPLRWLLKVWRQISHAAAVAGGIAIPWIEVPKLRRGEIAIRKRLAKVEKLLGVSALAVVMARVLQVSTRCLRDGNLGRGARQACSTDSSLWESLLGDLLAIVGVISVVEFAEGLLAIEDEAVSILAAGIREFPS